ATATGKIMLAFGSAQLPSGPLKAYTKRTITGRRRLAAELERIRRQGYAEAIGEREPDLNAIAAPIFGARGELAAIMGLQGPSARAVRAEDEERGLALRDELEQRVDRSRAPHT